jgi:hypothetical protein
MRRTVPILGLVALITLASSPAGAESYPQLRQGWLVGLGVGAGFADVTSGNSDPRLGFAGSFRVGYAFNPTLSLELGSTAWAKVKNGMTTFMSFAGPTVNFYPGAMGLVLRAGVGVGSMDFEYPVGSTTATVSEDGLGLSAGAGYEFRVTRRFALGPQVDITWSHLDHYDTDHINGCLAFTWYFIPQSAEVGR